MWLHGGGQLSKWCGSCENQIFVCLVFYEKGSYSCCSLLGVTFGCQNLKKFDDKCLLFSGIKYRNNRLSTS